MLGWCIDLPNRTIGIARRNLLKMVHGLFRLDVTSKHRLGTLEATASRMSRYAVLCPHMQPFTVSLYREITRYNGNRQTLRSLSGKSKTDILFWRSYMMLMGTQESRFARQLDTFRPMARPTFDFGFDASLDGMGIGVRKWNPTTGDFEMYAFASIFPSPFALTRDSSYQNVSEFATVICGILIALSTGHQDFVYSVAGDSRTALHWLQDGRVSSEIARRAAVGFAMASSAAHSTVGDVAFIRGIDNVVYDDLSRGRLSGHASTLDWSKRLIIEPGHPIHDYLQLCDPTRPLDTSQQQLHLYAGLTAQLQRLRPSVDRQEPPTS
jgi:hypothetical protein